MLALGLELIELCSPDNLQFFKLTPHFNVRGLY